MTACTIPAPCLAARPELGWGKELIPAPGPRSFVLSPKDGDLMAERSFDFVSLHIFNTLMSYFLIALRSKTMVLHADIALETSAL